MKRSFCPAGAPLRLEPRSDDLRLVISRHQIRLVFAAVKETILQNALRDSGIL